MSAVFNTRMQSMCVLSYLEWMAMDSAIMVRSCIAWLSIHEDTHREGETPAFAHSNRVDTSGSSAESELVQSECGGWMECGGKKREKPVFILCHRVHSAK